MNGSSPARPVLNPLLLVVLCAVAFQAVPVIKIGEYSSFKFVDVGLIFFFIIALTQKLSHRTWASVTVVLAAVTMHEVFQALTGKSTVWSSALIFAGRMILITAVVIEYTRLPQRNQFDARILKIYIRLIYFSIVYALYESYLLLNGLAPQMLPDVINGGGEPISRLRGTFTEPSLFVLFLTPALLAQLYRKAYLSASVIGIALVLTVSTFAVVVLALVVILFSTRRNAIIIGCGAGLALGLAIYVFGGDFVTYSFVDKFWTYLSFSATTDIISDSAGIRRSTASFGMKIAMENFPLGVGYGQSVSSLREYFPEALFKAGIVHPDIPIQSSLPQLMAESGIFGLLSAAPLIWASSSLLKRLPPRQFVAFVLYVGYMLIIIYPFENPIIWVFAIYFAIALRLGTPLTNARNHGRELPATSQ